MEIELLQWPAEEARRVQLSQISSPRILLVSPDVNPPVSSDPLEDWIRLPLDRTDLQARVEGLSRRANPHPHIDDDGVLHHGRSWVALPPVEARIMAELLVNFDRVVTRERLLHQGWPGEERRRNVLDVHLVRLRRRLEPLGLVITTVRKRGYVLQAE